MEYMSILVALLVGICFLILMVLQKLSDDFDDVKHHLGLKTQREKKADIRRWWFERQKNEKEKFSNMLEQGKSLSEIEQIIENAYKGLGKPHTNKSALLKYVRKVANNSK